MCENSPAEADLLSAMAPAEPLRRAGLHELVVIVKVAGPPLRFVVARGLLLVDVAHVLFSKRAIVEPIVAHPSVDHGVHRHGHFERRMRIDEGHQRQEAVVRNAENPNLAVAYGMFFTSQSSVS